MSFVDKDGYLNVADIVSLAKDIDKLATAEQMKATEVYFVPKVLPKYDAAKAKKGGVLFERKRAQIVKIKKRMPSVGSRMKMVVLLRLYKGIEDTEFGKEIRLALKAIEQHNKAAEKAIASIKKEALKKKESSAKEFDKNLAALEKLLLGAGLKKSDLAIGESPMGKSMVVKLSTGYITIGKADAEKFARAKEPKDPNATGFGRKAAPAAAKGKTKPATTKEKPVVKKAKTSSTGKTTKSAAKVKTKSKSR
jgi:hypothetical protein